MLAHRSGADWEVHAPAKLNLWFEVLARRADGYHEIATLMAPVSLFDTVRFRATSDGAVRLRCQTAAPIGAEKLWTDLPNDHRNLALRALLLLRERAGIEAGGEMLLVKRIPSAAGLGGGSSDAAAALVAANAAWSLQWDRTRLAEIAAELGSDVPFFLAGMPALCTGRGEKVQPIGGLGKLHFVVVRPDVGLATADVYRQCRPVESAAQPDTLLVSLRSGNLGRAGRCLLNRLQEPAARLSAAIDRLKQLFSNLDVAGHQMSGSGSSYFALCRSAAHARCVMGRLNQLGVGQAYAVSSVRH